MKVSIENVLCYERSEADIQPGVTYVTGPNSAGKSSFATILAALCAHDDNPLNIGITSKKSYILDGKLEGRATLDDGEVIWNPAVGISSEAGNIEAIGSRHSVGLVDFSHKSLSSKNRAALWEGMFLPDNAEELLRPAWTRSEPQLMYVLEEIKRNGWNTAKSTYEAQRAQAKRRWEVITGDRYGAKKATKWVPDGWRTELEGKSEEDIQSALVDARDQLQSTISMHAVKQEQVERANQILEKDIPAKEEAVKTLESELGLRTARFAKHEQMYRKKSEELSELNAYLSAQNRLLNLTKEPQSCPHCGGALTVNDGEIVADTASQNREKLREKIISVTSKYKRADKILKENFEEYSRLKELRDEIKLKLATANSEIARMKEEAKYANMEVNEGVDDFVRSAIENTIKSLQSDLAAMKSFREASLEAKNVIEMDAVCALLGTSGVRAKLMSDVLSKINKVLEQIEKVTGWFPIRLQSDYSVSSNGRPIQLVAANEKLKAQWSLQIASTMLTKHTVCVLDSADLLKGKDFEGLVVLADRLTKKMKHLHLVICGTDLPEMDSWKRIRLTASHDLT